MAAVAIASPGRVDAATPGPLAGELRWRTSRQLATGVDEVTGIAPGDLPLSTRRHPRSPATRPPLPAWPAATTLALVLTARGAAGDGDAGDDASASDAVEDGPAGEVVAVLPDDLTFEPSPLVDGATSATVVAGTMLYSTDEEFDRNEVVAYPAGSVIYTPAGTPHTMWARDGGIVVQEAGEGPTGLELVGQDG